MNRSIRTSLASAALTALSLLAAPAFAGMPQQSSAQSGPNKTRLTPDDLDGQQQQQQGSHVVEYTDNNLGVRGVLTARGFLVTHVVPGGVMQKLGLEEDDVIMTVDGRAVREWDDWVYAFSRRHAPGEPVALRIRDCRTGRTAFRYLTDL